MSQCLKISFSGTVPKKFLETLSENAKKLAIEGTVQLVSGKAVHLVICGSKDNCDQFLDVVHKEAVRQQFKDLIIEPFLKVKDYRGVFRIID